MEIKVLVPTPLRRLTGGEREVAAVGTTVGEVLDDLEKRYAGLKSRLFDDQGQLRRFVNIYLNEEDIRFSQGLATRTAAGDVLSIVPAIAGG